MGVIAWVVLGLIAGAVANAVHDGPEAGGPAEMLTVGVLGALLGGIVAAMVGLGAVSSLFSVGTWLAAAGGSLGLLVLYHAVVTGGNASSPRGV